MSAKQKRLDQHRAGSCRRPNRSSTSKLLYFFLKTHKTCPQSALDKPFRQEEKAQPWTCPDTRLLAMGVSYQHIFGTTTAIEPIFPRAEEDGRLNCNLTSVLSPSGNRAQPTASGTALNVRRVEIKSMCLSSQY
jgi:hypothetical protein